MQQQLVSTLIWYAFKRELCLSGAPYLPVSPSVVQVLDCLTDDEYIVGGRPLFLHASILNFLSFLILFFKLDFYTIKYIPLLTGWCYNLVLEVEHGNHDFRQNV